MDYHEQNGGLLLMEGKPTVTGNLGNMRKRNLDSDLNLGKPLCEWGWTSIKSQNVDIGGDDNINKLNYNNKPSAIIKSSVSDMKNKSKDKDSGHLNMDDSVSGTKNKYKALRFETKCGFFFPWNYNYKRRRKKQKSNNGLCKSESFKYMSKAPGPANYASNSQFPPRKKIEFEFLPHCSENDPLGSLDKGKRWTKKVGIGGKIGICETYSDPADVLSRSGRHNRNTNTNRNFKRHSLPGVELKWRKNLIESDLDSDSSTESEDESEEEDGLQNYSSLKWNNNNNNSNNNKNPQGNSKVFLDSKQPFTHQTIDLSTGQEQKQEEEEESAYQEIYDSLDTNINTNYNSSETDTTRISALIPSSLSCNCLSCRSLIPLTQQLNEQYIKTREITHSLLLSLCPDPQQQSQINSRDSKYSGDLQSLFSLQQHQYSSIKLNPNSKEGELESDKYTSKRFNVTHDIVNINFNRNDSDAIAPETDQNQYEEGGSGDLNLDLEYTRKYKYNKQRVEEQGQRRIQRLRKKSQRDNTTNNNNNRNSIKKSTKNLDSSHPPPLEIQKQAVEALDALCFKQFQSKLNGHCPTPISIPIPAPKLKPEPNPKPKPKPNPKPRLNQEEKAESQTHSHTYFHPQALHPNLNHRPVQPAEQIETIRIKSYDYHHPSCDIESEESERTNTCSSSNSTNSNNSSCTSTYRYFSPPFYTTSISSSSGCSSSSWTSSGSVFCRCCSIGMARKRYETAFLPSSSGSTNDGHLSSPDVDSLLLAIEQNSLIDSTISPSNPNTNTNTNTNVNVSAMRHQHHHHHHPHHFNHHRHPSQNQNQSQIQSQNLSPNQHDSNPNHPSISSISIFRDRDRECERDCSPSSLSIKTPNQNQNPSPGQVQSQVKTPHESPKSMAMSVSKYLKKYLQSASKPRSRSSSPSTSHPSSPYRQEIVSMKHPNPQQQQQLPYHNQYQGQYQSSSFPVQNNERGEDEPEILEEEEEEVEENCILKDYVDTTNNTNHIKSINSNILCKPSLTLPLSEPLPRNPWMANANSNAIQSSSSSSMSTQSSHIHSHGHGHITHGDNSNNKRNSLNLTKDNSISSLESLDSTKSEDLHKFRGTFNFASKTNKLLSPISDKSPLEPAKSMTVVETSSSFSSRGGGGGDEGTEGMSVRDILRAAEKDFDVPWDMPKLRRKLAVLADSGISLDLPVAAPSVSRDSFSFFTTTPHQHVAVQVEKVEVHHQQSSNPNESLEHEHGQGQYEKRGNLDLKLPSSSSSTKNKDNDNLECDQYYDVEGKQENYLPNDCNRSKFISSKPDRSKVSLNFSNSNNTNSTRNRRHHPNPLAIIDFNPNLELECQDWFFGILTRCEAEDILRSTRSGSFLVRNCESSIFNQYSISLKCAKGFIHIRIEMNSNGTYILADQEFPSVPHLVLHFMENNLPIRGGETMRLIYPVLNQVL